MDILPVFFVNGNSEADKHLYQGHTANKQAIFIHVSTDFKFNTLSYISFMLDEGLHTQRNIL